MVDVAKKQVKRVVVERHKLGYRVLHWAFVTGMLLLIITGLEIGGIYGNLPLIPNVRAWHIVIGIAWLCICFAFLYYLLATGDYKWYGLRRLPLAISFLWKEAKAWLKIGPHVEEPILYDTRKEEYVEKVVPTVVMVWWIYFAIAALLGITGAAMVFPDFFWFVYAIADALAPIFGGIGGYALVRCLHRFGLYLFIFVAIMHAYAAYVFKVLRSITFGDRAEPAK